MMLIDEQFELGIPTHIKFTLFKYDYFDSIIITRVKRECKNLSNVDGEFTINAASFINAIKTSKRVRSQIQKSTESGFNPNIKPNSVYFIWSIFNRLTNI